MAGHTPEPWSIERHEYVSGGWPLCLRRVGPALILSNAPSGTPDGDRADADTRLIATAPDLLEALANLCDRCESGHFEASTPIAESIARAHDVIARATKP